MRLLKKVTNSAANDRKLGELVARFELVSESADPLREKVQWDRTNDALCPLHDLARHFLAREWQGTMIGKIGGISLLFEMYDLFEKYVGRMLRIALAPVSVNLRQERVLISGSHLGFKVIPDIVIKDEIILDAKWKQLEPAEPNFGVQSRDIYQMLAYARAYCAKHLVLLYPWHEDLEKKSGECWHSSVTGSNVTLSIATVDVGKPTEDVKIQLRNIVSSVQKHRNLVHS